MKTARSIIAALIIATAATAASGENSYGVYVDDAGIMRRDDNRAEVRYYGVNYTVPFAHAYRALGYLGIDPKQAIDRDVYHFARLGLNAFRLHLWDVELTDSVGNLICNDHLDLLDYLIAAVERRGMSVVITAQTNFGNGYPERNINTGAYSYRYSKCDVHRDAAAIAAQQRYLEAMVAHVNPYTSRSYADDRSIIALELNNEPCHWGDKAPITAYIDTVAAAARRGGWRKPILYNVSHNADVTSAYYDAADIAGTTYQWYPIGLVAGHERKGNFLPNVDSYDIPFDTIPAFASKARVVYEYDPADILATYMYPAATRTFAAAGFQWITQFAYDPIDLAPYNTEYQTHYLNLAYTPGKAIGMMIAAKVAQRVPRGADYGAYPTDTVFDVFSVSAKHNLAMMNAEDTYLYTNSCSAAPVKPASLRHIAGCGSSPIVSYSGRGAYFIDRVAPGKWRLEVMPDVLYAADPFAKPSLSRRVAHTIYARHTMALDIADLGRQFSIIDSIGDVRTAADGAFDITPGVYLLARPGVKAAIDDIDRTFVAPEPYTVPLTLTHTPAAVVSAADNLVITAEVFGSVEPDSVVVYPADASFWNDHNTLFRLKRVAPYTYSTEVSNSHYINKQQLDYRIVVHAGAMSATYPDGIAGTPLDWDARDNAACYHTAIHHSGDPLILWRPDAQLDGAEISLIPDDWRHVRFHYDSKAPIAADALCVNVSADGDAAAPTVVFTKQLAGLITSDIARRDDTVIKVKLRGEAPRDLTLTLINDDGITYTLSESHRCADNAGGVIIAYNVTPSAAIAPTLLCPAPYPSFLTRSITPSNLYRKPLALPDVQALRLTASASFDLCGIWLE